VLVEGRRGVGGGGGASESTGSDDGSTYVWKRGTLLMRSDDGRKSRNIKEQ